MTAARGPIANMIGRIRGIWTLEMEGFDTLPGRRWGVLGATVAVAVVFSLLRLGISDIYTESIPFLILALALGFLGRAPGALLVVLHIVFDLARSLAGPSTLGYDTTPELLLGRVISYWLLWVLAVIIPTLQRVTHQATIGWLSERRAPTLAAGPLSAAVAGLLVYLWSTAEPFLIRPAFGGSPTVAAMEPQRTGWLVAVAAFGIGTAVAVTIQRRVWTGADLIPIVRRSGRFDAAGLLMRLAAYAAAIVLLLGLITSPLDVLLLGAALVGGELLVPILGGAQPIRALLQRVPFIVRLVVGLAATFLVAHLFFNVFYQPLLGSEFFPIVLALAIGLVIFRVLVETPARSLGDRSLSGRATPGTVMLVLIGAGAGWLALPGPVSADNCSGLSDCTIQDLSQVALAVTAITGSLWTMLSGSLQKTPPSMPPPGPPDAFRRELGEGLGIPGEYINVQQHGDDFWKFQVRVRGDTPLPTGDTIQGWIDAGQVPEGHLTGADTLVVGAVQKAGDMTRVNVRTVDVETGVVGDAGVGTAGSLGEAARGAGEKMGITWGAPASTGRIE